MRLTFEQRRPPEELALAQHEAGRTRALAADQEFHSAGIKYEKIIGGIANVIERSAGGVLFLSRERHDCSKCLLADAGEELSGVQRALSDDIQRVALELYGKALERRFRQAHRGTCTYIPLP